MKGGTALFDSRSGLRADDGNGSMNSEQFWIMMMAGGVLVGFVLGIALWNWLT